MALHLLPEFTLLTDQFSADRHGFVIQLIQKQLQNKSIVTQTGRIHNRRELLQYKGHHAIIPLFRVPEQGTTDCNRKD